MLQEAGYMIGISSRIYGALAMKHLKVAAVSLISAVMMGNFSSAGEAQEAAGAYDWTGFYIGAHAGAAMARYRASGAGLFDGDAMVKDLKDTAFIGGLTLGYNRQLMNNMVVGLETDIGFMGISKRVEGLPTFDDTDNFARLKQGFYMDLTGRLGFSYASFLFYGKAGLVLSRIKLEAADLAAGSIDTSDYTSVNKTRAGYTVGGGVEYAVTDAMSIKTEYRYMDFGRISSTNGDGESIRHRVKDHAITVGVNYKLPY